MKAIYTFFLFSCIWFPLQATNARFENLQSISTDPLTIATKYIQTHMQEWGLAESDITGMTISDRYTDKSSGITRIYFEQRYNGIPVNHAILNVCLTRDNKVYYSTCRFVPNLEGKINAVKPSLSAVDAINKTALHFGFSATALKEKTAARISQFTFEDPSIAREDITVNLCYLDFQGKINLTWDVFFAPLDSYDGWNTRIDAITGEVLNKVNRTLYCKSSDDDFPDLKEIHAENTNETKYHTIVDDAAVLIRDNTTGSRYNVWPAPMESAGDGPRIMVTNPADIIASPYGWHDIDGQEGSEFSVTGGNNCYAYQDTLNLGYSSHDEPDGGPELVFDFPFDSTWEPRQYVDAATVNLFYWINYLHDFTYRFGFDESAGNFQENNYGRGGQGSDFVWAVAQCGSTGDSLYNNAAYVNKNEGSNPSIFMFDFLTPEIYFEVNEPAAVAGHYGYNYPSAGWGAGAYVSDVPVIGEVVIVNDGVEMPSAADACQPILNADELAGKIAMIDRGSCQFAYKALQAQNAGAIAVIICSADDKLYTMAAGPDAPAVGIPVISIPLKYAKTLRQFAGNGLKVTIVNHHEIHPARYDSDLQNSMIAHEYGHGLSIRLAGGPDKACLDNAEQMGEGWSDFLGLVTTVKPGDTGSMPKGLGTYVKCESNLDNGLRRYPYCTDLSISPLTYGDVAINQEKHEIGEVWAAMLWDMYWAMVDKYGWSIDQYNEQSGNYKAIRLVVDGLKNMACDPGFVDGRDAILAADSALYEGKDICLLWNVFARRGLGYSADQGSSNDAGDQIEAFDLPPACSNTVTIDKTVTDFIQPGEDIAVIVHVANYTSTMATHVVVSDHLPEGTTFISSSSNYNVDQQGNQLHFDMGSLSVNEIKTLTYKIHTPDDVWSKRIFLDEVADTTNVIWIPLALGTAAGDPWSITDTWNAHSGHFSWTTKEIGDKSQQALVLNPDVSILHVEGEKPTLRFYHRFDTQAGLNGGMVEVKEVGEIGWHRVDDQLIRNGYRRRIDYLTFLTTGLNAFSGKSGDEFQATYVDLSPWKGLDIQFRFRFGTSVNTHGGMGWSIDDIEFLDMKNYNEEVCVTSEQGNFECATAPEAGTIIDSRWDPVSGVETLQDLEINMYPNPASDLFTISFSLEKEEDVHVSILALDGHLISAKSLTGYGYTLLNVNTMNLPSGIYLVKVGIGNSQDVQMMVVQH